MGVSIDHLHAGLVVSILRAFEDADGRRHDPGETWEIEAISFDPVSFIATFNLSVQGKAMVARLDLRTRIGPRIGTMREWFKVMGEAPETIGEPSGVIGSLSFPQGFEELASADAAAVDALVTRLSSHPIWSGDNLPNLAEGLEQSARILFPRDRHLASHVYAKAIDCWYGWGAMATSGGDGVYRRPYIAAAEQRRAALFGDRA